MNKISRVCTYRPSLSITEISRNKVNVAEAAFFFHVNSHISKTIINFK